MSRIIDANPWNEAIILTPAGIFIISHKFFGLYNANTKELTIFTDSVCTTKKLDYNSEKLGEFSFDNTANNVYVLQNGFYRFNEKWKQRGLGNLGTKEIEHLDTIERGDALFYTYKVLRSNRLRSSILSDTVSDIGKFTTFERQVNLNADKKRLGLRNYVPFKRKG